MIELMSNVYGYQHITFFCVTLKNNAFLSIFTSNISTFDTENDARVNCEGCLMICVKKKLK